MTVLAEVRLQRVQCILMVWFLGADPMLIAWWSVRQPVDRQRLPKETRVGYCVYGRGGMGNRGVCVCVCCVLCVCVCLVCVCVCDVSSLRHNNKTCVQHGPAA